jgi:hypothetical protein
MRDPAQVEHQQFERFSEMTTSVVAVITDVVRDGKVVVGFAFNSPDVCLRGGDGRASFHASWAPIRNPCR